MAAVLDGPSEGAFDAPAFRQHDEAFHADRSQNPMQYELKDMCVESLKSENGLP